MPLADKAAFPLPLSIRKTINLLWNNFNTLVIIISFSHQLLLWFSVVSLIESCIIFLSIADVTACFHLENDDVVTPCWLQKCGIHHFIPVISLSLAFS